MNIFKHFKKPEKPILVIGKGPTYTKRFKVDERKYFTIGINHVKDVDMSHQIDWNATDYTQKTVVQPYYPLLNNKRCAEKSPELPHVYHYNFQTHPPVDDTPVIVNDQFSIHCILQILIFHGVNEIFTAGIDGENGYADQFNKRIPRPEGYTKQWRMIDKLKKEHGLAIISI